jgi:flagellar FliL protein
MADAKKTEAAETTDVPKKKTKLLLIIIIAALVVVLGGGAAAFLLLKKPAADEELDEDADAPPAKVVKAKKKKPASGQPPVFLKLEPFVVKLQVVEQQQESYVQCIPELKLIDAPTAEMIKQYTPEIRHKILLILAGKTAAELGNPEGMQTLANQIRESINTTLLGEKPDPAKEKLNENDDGPIVSVFFSSLIVQ